MRPEDEQKKPLSPVSRGDRIVFLGFKGALIATVFLFTPLLTMLLNTIGFSSMAPLLNALMFPLLFVCFGVVGYGMWLKKRPDPEA